jgi:hypothetical protein
LQRLARSNSPLLRSAEQAEKDFKVAEFFRLKGLSATACIYYELVRRRYPGTDFAIWAADHLRALRTKAEEERKPAEQQPLRVGQIKVVGNIETPQWVILEQVQLYPGQILSLPDLLAAERRLERLKGIEVDPEKGIRPTVSAMNPDQDSPYKDILIRVQEK